MPFPSCAGTLVTAGNPIMKKEIIYQPAILNVKNGKKLCTISKTHSKYLNFCHFSEHSFVHFLNICHSQHALTLQQS
jgi:hypothetical protein